MRLASHEFTLLLCAMLRQLLENQILNLQILVDECNQILDEGIRLPLEHWRGAREGFSSTAYDLCCVLDEASDDEQLVGYLDGLIYAWVEHVMDLHDRIGECDYGGEREDSIRLTGSLSAYAHVYREISQLVEGPLGRNRDASDCEG